MTDYRYDFESGTDYLNACRPDQERGVNDSFNFTKTRDYPAAVTLAREGWQDGLDKIARLSDGITAEFAGRIMREEWVPDVVGNYLDIGKYLTGEPDCWNRLEEVETHAGNIRPHVRLLYNGTVSAAISTDIITARGAATAALVDLLELAGYSVTVQVAFSVKSSYTGTPAPEDTITDLVTVKPAGERTDLSALMFWTAHPSALRRLAFAHWETFPATVRRTFGFYKGFGYGNVCELPAHDGADIYISGADSSDVQWQNLESARRWIEATLIRLGVKLAK